MLFLSVFARALLYFALSNFTCPCGDCGSVWNIVIMWKWYGCRKQIRLTSFDAPHLSGHYNCDKKIADGPRSTAMTSELQCCMPPTSRQQTIAGQFLNRRCHSRNLVEGLFGTWQLLCLDSRVRSELILESSQMPAWAEAWRISKSPSMGYIHSWQNSIHFLCLLLGHISLNICTSHITSTPRAFEVSLQFMRYTTYLLRWLG